MGIGHILSRLIALCVMLASLCGCEIVGLGEDRHVDTQSQLDYNRKKWDSEMASAYQLSSNGPATALKTMSPQSISPCATIAFAAPLS